MIKPNDRIRVNAKHLNGEKFTTYTSLTTLGMTVTKAEDITPEYITRCINAMVKTCIENNAIVQSIEYENIEGW